MSKDIGIFLFKVPDLRARSIPFFWSTNVDPLTKLDKTAITTPTTGNAASSINLVKMVLLIQYVSLDPMKLLI